MKRAIGFVVFALLPGLAFATGATVTTGNSAASTSQVSITIPAVIAIDVETNLTFDFTTYAVPASPTDCANRFPPGADCAPATFTPTSATEPASGVTPNIWLSIFSNAGGHQSTMTVTAYGDAAFTSNPGFTPQAIRLRAAASHNNAVNGKTFGPATATFIGTSGTPLDLGSGAMSTSVFGWTRLDQTADIALAGTTAFNAVTGATANITFTLKY